MKVLITLPPIKHLIAVLRYLVAGSHPNYSFLKPEEAMNPNYDERIKNKKPEEVDFLRLFTFDKKKNPKVFSTIWGTYSSSLLRIGMPSFKIARKTFSTTARRKQIDEGYVRTMLGQKDKSISISYVDYDDPQLFAQLCLAHIEVLWAFDIIQLYNAWLIKIDETIGSNWRKTDVFIKQKPDYIYSEIVRHLQPIIENSKTIIK